VQEVSAGLTPAIRRMHLFAAQFHWYLEELAEVAMLHAHGASVYSSAAGYDETDRQGHTKPTTMTVHACRVCGGESFLHRWLCTSKIGKVWMSHGFFRTDPLLWISLKHTLQ